MQLFPEEESDQFFISSHSPQLWTLEDFCPVGRHRCERSTPTCLLLDHVVEVNRITSKKVLTAMFSIFLGSQNHNWKEKYSWFNCLSSDFYKKEVFTKFQFISYQHSETQCFLLHLLFLLEFKNWPSVSFSLFLTIISRVVRHPDSGWKLSETGEEVAGRRHFMGQIRHLRGVRRSTKRLRLSPADKHASPA